MLCPDCERLDEKEAEASTALVGTDEEWPREVSGPAFDRWRQRKSAADARLQAAREQREAHRAWHRLQS